MLSSAKTAFNMALLEILQFPHPSLRKKAKPIEKVEKGHLQLSKNMLETMYHHRGIGLASTQVHREDVRLIVVDIGSSRPSPISSDDSHSDDSHSTDSHSTDLSPSDSSPTKPKQEEKPPRYLHPVWTDLEKATPMPLILINPECIEHRGAILSKEGCLSIPSYMAEIKRKAWVKISGLNLQGEKVTLEADGLLGICLQHEIDHLNGKLFIDHLSLIKANRIKAQIRKYGYPKEETLSKDLSQQES